MARDFLPYNLDQHYLLPPDLREWVPENHLIWFLSDVVDGLDLSAILRTYEKDDLRGRAGYHPALMVRLTLYAYCLGMTSSRRIERATYEDLPFRVLAANQHPDHDTLAEFRRRHLEALAALFLQVLRLCQAAGLVELGHVALDGTKVKADASRHKAMSYERMLLKEEELMREVDALLKEAERTDREEDRLFGKKRGDELPDELARRESRLKKIREAKAALEAEARAQAEVDAEDALRRIEERAEKEKARGRKFGGRPPQVPDPAKAVPRLKAQRNFTDPDSRIMVDGATKAFVQAYNAHAAVDEHSQIIVAASLTQQANDKQAFLPLLTQTQENRGALPKRVSADSGFFSEANVCDPALEGVTCYVPPEKSVTDSGVATAMRERLAGEEGRALYARRKAVVEPVFGQIKEARGFRRFSFRGFCAVEAEWQLVCLTHNLLKLFRAHAGPMRPPGRSAPRSHSAQGRRERIWASQPEGRRGIGLTETVPAWWRPIRLSLHPS
jgi:transposase